MIDQKMKSENFFVGYLLHYQNHRIFYKYIINAINKQLCADGFLALVTEAEKKSHQ